MDSILNSVCRHVAIDDHDVFYREAGDPGAPAVLLLHSLMTSSHMFRKLMPLLADRYHVVAPDLPGFGFSAIPDRARFKCTFDNLAKVIERFAEKIGLTQYAIYVFDYGAPIGFHLALAHPERVLAIISQDDSAYVDGFSRGWNPIRTYWTEPTAENRAALRGFLTLETVIRQYALGVADKTSDTLDAEQLARPDDYEVQLDLFLDCAGNVALYPQFQAYLHAKRLPFLAVWGKNHQFSLPTAAETFKQDNPDAEFYFYETGHFALEMQAGEIGAVVHEFLDRRVG